jgi:hypothetical protein
MDAAMMRRIFMAMACITALGGCVAKGGAASSDVSREDIYVLRSIREPHATDGAWCDAGRTGFAPMPTDAERYFSFWSIDAQPDSGRITDTSSRRVAELHACFGATTDRTRQNFHAEVRHGGTSFQGRGECVMLLADVPEPGMYAVRCHLVLSGLSAPYRAGLLTTSTLTSRAPFGGDTDPPGYTQASIATIRLWR